MIDIEFRNLEQLKTQFDPRVVNQSLSRTINGIASKSKTRVSVEVRKIYNVKAGKINQTVGLRRASVAKPDAVLKWVGRKIGLVNFGAKTRNVTITATSSKGKSFKTKRKQTRVRVRKSGGLRVASSRDNKGFVALGQGNKHIFARKKGSNKLIALLGPSVPEMVDDRKVIDVANKLIKSDFDKDFKSNMEFYLGKKVGLY